MLYTPAGVTGTDGSTPLLKPGRYQPVPTRTSLNP